MKEIFKDIKDYEGLYQVSNFGNVKSLSKKVNIAYGNKRTTRERILKPYTDKRGSKHVIMCGKTIRVHRLVAIAFIPNRKNKECVNHKDGNPSNNHIDNLEWLTKGENNAHAFKIGLKKPTKNKKLMKPVLQIKNNLIINRFESLHEAGRITGIKWSSISRVCRGIRKHTGGFKWRYSDAS